MCAFLPYRTRMGNARSGSILPVREADDERPVFAHSGRLESTWKRLSPIWLKSQQRGFNSKLSSPPAQ